MRCRNARHHFTFASGKFSTPILSAAEFLWVKLLFEWIPSRLFFEEKYYKERYFHLRAVNDRERQVPINTGTRMCCVASAANMEKLNDNHLSSMSVFVFHVVPTTETQQDVAMPDPSPVTGLPLMMVCKYQVSDVTWNGVRF